MLNYSNETVFAVGRGTGDPHYLTFDGRYHTFNGRGDFTIMEIVSGDGVTPEFSIQGRLDRVRRWRVATHQGLAFGNEDLAFHVSEWIGIASMHVIFSPYIPTQYIHLQVQSSIIKTYLLRTSFSVHISI